MIESYKKIHLEVLKLARKSIIDKVIEENKKQKEEKKRKQKENNRYIQRLRGEISSYISSVVKKLENNKPLYTPRGKWIGNAKWIVNSNYDSFELVAKEKFSKKLLILTGTFIQSLDMDKINSLFSHRSEEVNSSPYKLSVLSCFVVDKCENEKLKNFFSSYEHYGYFPFLYSINLNKIWYNKSIKSNEYFASWFDSHQRPIQISDIIDSIVDRHGIFNLKAIQDKFDFNRKEAEKMLQYLEIKNLIFHLKGNEYVLNK